MNPEEKILVAALTHRGGLLAREIASRLEGVRLCLPHRLSGSLEFEEPFQGQEIHCFDKFSALAEKAFEKGQDLVCIMACGIVVRGIAPFLKGKDQDPAVVVVDERGKFAISLVSGHLGGANALAKEVAEAIGATPVITTATDVNGLPAIDTMAVNLGMEVENISGIRHVHMAMIEDRPVGLFDENSHFKSALSSYSEAGEIILKDLTGKDLSLLIAKTSAFPVIYVGNKEPGRPWPENWLVLRPKDLVAGIGCNRGTSAGEIQGLLEETFKQAGLSLKSLGVIASVDVKRDETGLLEVIEALEVETRWFNPEDLKRIKVPSPSQMVESYVGTPSVCEAAAILGAGGGRLLVGKTKSPNVTLAVAQAASM